MFGLQQEADRINNRKSLQGAALAKNRQDRFTNYNYCKGNESADQMQASQ